ncbi:EAL domain-containing protein [Aquibium microcysteis]|uniref:bifunctional diguanylate cyclase/phosphodiesterase n=1 Tax=Aquibium microcysteis TaxID=675281 RepID=UPI001EF1E679|nr:EAL domain-containing protein [Aquibium microcysteis]
MVVALAVICGTVMLVEHRTRALHDKELRADVYNRVTYIRSRLEGVVNGDLQLIRGLAAAIAADPTMSQEQFSAFAAHLMQTSDRLSHVAAAPDMVVSLIHPLAGHEQALGLDYLAMPAQREAVLKARDTGKLVLTGPVDLVQGGKGLVGRYPVFVEENGGRRFWGVVSAVIDLEAVYVDSGLSGTDLPIEIAISARDAPAPDAVFLGSPHVLRHDPVVVEASFPSTSWRLHAIPASGWNQPYPYVWQIRGFLLATSIVLLLPIVATGRLIEERQRNIGELSRREKQLSRLSRRLRLALDTSQVGVWEMEIDSKDLFWDDRMNELYGYPADGRLRDYTFWSRRIHPEDMARAEREFRIAMDETGRYHSEYRLLLPSGTVRHIRSIGTVYRDFGEPARIVGVNWDVSADIALNEDLKRAKALTDARNHELESAKERIEFIALHDSLTGLPNRRYLDQMLAEHVERFAKGEETAGLLHIDLDRFKQINDTLGHAAGDAMLAHTARILRATARTGDFVARVGGDEFVVLCRRPRGSDEEGFSYLTEFAERVIEQIQQPVSHGGHECRIGVSIGIASDKDAVADPRQLLVHADIALYRAKNRGRNRYQIFNDVLRREIVIQKNTADEILTAIEQGQFLAHYQPQFDATTLEIVGIEALARWDHPSKGLLLPAAFMKIAEEINVVDVIDRVILEQTLADLERWDAQGIDIPKVSVNVSARRLNDDELIGSLRRLPLSRGRISFELVESIFLDEQDESIAWNVDLIKDLGIAIEIDDFGTGYASIVSLMKLKPSRLKIDRQLVMPIVQSIPQRHLVQSIIDIGKSLGIEVLAEGVETMDHARVLKTLGCDALQGYAFAKPMSAADVTVFARERRWREAG